MKRPTNRNNNKKQVVIRNPVAREAALSGKFYPRVVPNKKKAPIPFDKRQIGD